MTETALPTAAPADLSGLTQPSAGPVSPAAAVTASGSMSTPNPPAPPAEALTPGMAAPDVTDRSINPAVPPAAPAGAGAPPKHARLLSMIQGLADGLSAAGTSIATHGREGGAEEVQQLQAQRQQMKQSADTAAQAKAAAAQDYAIKTQTLNGMNLNNRFTTATFHNKVAQSDMEAASAKIKTGHEAQEVFDTTGHIPEGWHGDPNTGQMLLGPAPAAGAPGATPAAAPGAPAPTTVYDNRSKILLGYLGKELEAKPGQGDPDVTAALAVFNNPQSTLEQKQQALIGAQRKAGLNQQVLKNLTEKADLAAKQQTVSAGARPKDLDDATGRVTAAQLAYKNSPSPTTKTALDNAKDAQSEFMRVDKEKKQAAQDIQNGDPTVIGDMLANGTAAPSQVQSARSMSKPFYAQVLARANATAKANGAPEVIGPNGKPTGQYFNEATAESQYQYSKNVQTQNTLNKIRTLNEPGGDLDILKDATAALPKMDQKTLNKIFNASATEFGSPEATNYHTALYNLAGLLAQVQTGGIPTEGEIQAQLNLMSAANSKGQLDGQIQIARKDIAARGTSMVAKNPFLRNAYPDLVQTNQSAATPSGKAVSLKAAMALPINVGKTADQVRADIQAHGHQVGE